MNFKLIKPAESQHLAIDFDSQNYRPISLKLVIFAQIHAVRSYEPRLGIILELT